MKGCRNICCMIFLNNMLMTSPYIVFYIPFDLIYGSCYLLHAKITLFFLFFFCFCFPVGPNPTIFDKTRFLISWNLDYKIDWFEVFVLNSLLKLLGKSQVWITSRLVYVLTITHFARNTDLILTILLKYRFLDCYSAWELNFQNPFVAVFGLWIQIC